QLQEALARVQCVLEQVTERAGLASHFIQQIELGGSAQYPLVPAPPSGRCQQAGGASSDPQERLRAAFATLSQGKGRALGDEQLCIAFLDAVGGVLAGDPAKPQEIRKGILDARGIERRQACNEDMKAVIDELGLFLTDTMQLIDGDAAQQARLPDHLKKESLVFLPKVRALSSLSTTYKTLIAGVDPLLQKEADARKAGAQLALFEERLRDFTIGALAPCTDDANAKCVSAAEVTRRMVLESETKPIRFDKIQNHSIKLKNNAPLATTVVASRPAEVEAGYSLDSVFRDLWGIGASVVYTPLQAPTFSAVSNMATPPQMVIDETGQETRAGQIALLMHYRLGKRLCPQCGGLVKAFGVEFGSGIETSKPAFFGGLSFQLGKYVRLGAGVTTQQIKELRNQELGDIVAAAADVKTRDTFKEDYYISLSIAFESLRLFTAGD
ncbi:MAG TPA: hypothetical protein VLE27_07900, partial [Thermoanaerobaculia bacterium]|nr:hypothetical protein [Thermoanaerobaculia bacterium]